VRPVEGSSPAAGVVVGQQRSAADVPAALGPDPYARIGDQILHVMGSAPVFGDQPERVAVEAASDWSLARQPGPPARVLQQSASDTPSKVDARFWPPRPASKGGPLFAVQFS
jgi:hypothetical protein